MLSTSITNHRQIVEKEYELLMAEITLLRADVEKRKATITEAQYQSIMSDVKTLINILRKQVALGKELF